MRDRDSCFRLGGDEVRLAPADGGHHAAGAGGGDPARRAAWRAGAFAASFGVAVALPGDTQEMLLAAAGMCSRRREGRKPAQSAVVMNSSSGRPHCRRASRARRRRAEPRRSPAGCGRGRLRGQCRGARRGVPASAPTPPGMVLVAFHGPAHLRRELAAARLLWPSATAPCGSRSRTSYGTPLGYLGPSRAPRRRVGLPGCRRRLRRPGAAPGPRIQIAALRHRTLWRCSRRLRAEFDVRQGVSTCSWRTWWTRSARHWATGKSSLNVSQLGNEDGVCPGCRRLAVTAS